MDHFRCLLKIMSKRRILINGGTFIIFYLILFLYVYLVAPTISRNLEMNFYSNRIGAFYYSFLPPIILSAIIIGRWMVLRRMSADKGKAVLIADIVELILSILVPVVIVFSGYSANGLIYMVFYCVSCAGTLISDLI